MTLEFTPRSILDALYEVSGKAGYYFPYGLRAKYEDYDIGRGREPHWEPYQYDLYRISRYVEEAGGEDTDRRLGHILRGRVLAGGGITYRMDEKELTFIPDKSLSIAEVAKVIMDCKKAGLNIGIPEGSDLSNLINTAALLVDA